MMIHWYTLFRREWSNTAVGIHESSNRVKRLPSVYASFNEPQYLFFKFFFFYLLVA